MITARTQEVKTTNIFYCTDETFVPCVVVGWLVVVASEVVVSVVVVVVGVVVDVVLVTFAEVIVKWY